MIDTKTVSPHSMFLKYLRDLAVSLKEEPDKWRKRGCFYKLSTIKILILKFNGNTTHSSITLFQRKFPQIYNE